MSADPGKLKLPKSMNPGGGKRSPRRPKKEASMVSQAETNVKPKKIDLDESRYTAEADDDGETMELKGKLKNYIRKCRDLHVDKENLLNQFCEVNEEKDSLIIQIQDMTNEHKDICGSLEKQKDNLLEKQRFMQERVDRVERIENAIINLYLEMKDRSAEGEEPDLNNERNELKKINQPLVVLDFLRANLRNLLAFKEDYENELRAQLSRKKTAQEIEIDELHGTLDKQKEHGELLQDTAKNAVKKMKEAESAKELVIDESHNLIDQIKEDNRKLIELTRSKDEDLKRLKAALDKREQIIRNQDMKLLRIAQLESQIQFNKMQHQADLNKLQTQHVKTLQLLQKEMGKFTKTEAENKLYEEKLSSAATQVSAYRKDIRRTRFEEMERRIAKQERMIHQQNETINGLQKDARHSGIQAEQYAQKNATLKKEYDKLFSAVNQEQLNKKKEEKMKIKSGNVHKQADENPFFIDFYRNKLREKEREVDELASKVKRLMQSQHKSTLIEKSFELERTRLESQVAILRTEGAPKGGVQQGSIRAPRGGRMSPGQKMLGRMDAEMKSEQYMEIQELHNKNSLLEDQLKEFHNMKTVSSTVKAAYNRLVQETDLGNIDESAPGGGQSVEFAESATHISQEDSRQEYRPTKGGNPASRPMSSTSSRPTSASSSRSRPTSAQTGRALKGVGASHSAMQVKSLLRPASAQK